MFDSTLLFNILIYIPIVLFSITIHEAAHGYAAFKMGDPTAKILGRITLNPLKHLHPIGSFALPIILLSAGLPPFGYAKPVPVDFRRLRDQKWGYAIVGFAGPLANISFAFAIGILIRILYFIINTGLVTNMTTIIASMIDLMSFIFLLNMILALFNMIPMPPLDGSRILFGFLSTKNRMIMHRMERYTFFVLIFLILTDSYTGIFSFIFDSIFIPVISLFFYIITGLKF